jgi:hypothetical protein
MKNKYEDFCYVCGEVVPEEKGVAEQRARSPGDPGWGATRWVTRHTTCKPQEESHDSSRSSKDGASKN